MIITVPIFEAYLMCPSKCWFLFFGKEGDANLYSDFMRNQSNAYRTSFLDESYKPRKQKIDWVTYG
jgi:CRISPR/Cas system-associated exonuclease Cas4 (RecB family)